MTPLTLYYQKCHAGLIFKDSQQIEGLRHLEKVFHALIKENQYRLSLFSWLRKPKLIKGVYLWGGVGIGKTLMMDCFFESLTFPNKLRMHFHQFMQMIHQQLTSYQGKSEPLQLIANELAKKYLVICFDELFVSDITDAMLLGKLFNYLFMNGVTLIATSNAQPDDLYKHGLQRSQFLPAIELLKKHSTVIHLPSATDYRLRHLKEAGVFYTPLDETAKKNMQKTFSILKEGESESNNPIEINDRLIPVVKRTKNIIWFEFKDICRVPRSQQDYLKIADQFHAVFISNIPIINPQEKDTICLFISLVDVFYDAKVKLVISSAEPVADIYNRGYMIMEYTRTNSRLVEMQSVDYFSKEHSNDPSH